MFLAPLKGLLVKAMAETFGPEYPESDFRSLHVSVEYPDSREHYPGIWVDFDPTGQLTKSSVSSAEWADPASDGTTRQVTRWRFQGYATYTIVALTSLERDRLFDEVVRVMAFGPESGPTATFRYVIENNDLVACNFDFDEVGVRGTQAVPGTPWGSDEVIYETTVAMECLGEFISDGISPTLLPLSTIVLTPFSDRDPDPTTDQGWM